MLRFIDFSFIRHLKEHPLTKDYFVKLKNDSQHNQIVFKKPQFNVLGKVWIWLIIVIGIILLGLLSGKAFGFSKAPPTAQEIVKKAPEGTISAVFPEGSSTYKMSVILEHQGYLSYEAFRDYADRSPEPEWFEKYPFLAEIPIKSTEGYLYPDTYVFSKYMSARRLALVMIRRFNELVIPVWKVSASDTKLSLHEIVTLASIIEKEAQVPEERPIISSVYHNRLRIGMKLDADPTVKYSLENPKKKVSYNDLKVKSPYNTYRVRGLPPGPICNPSLDSIKAAIYPAKTTYLYFVATKTGSHLFSSSWDEHQKARIKAKY